MRAVLRVLRAKFLAGLFEHPFADADAADAAANTPAHQAGGLDAARKSIVLRHERQPRAAARSPPVRRRLAVVGPNAKGVHLGGYSRDPGRKIDVLSGIQASAGPGVRVLLRRRRAHHRARRRLERRQGRPRRSREEPRADQGGRRSRAPGPTRSFSSSGTNESTSREAWSDSHLGDVADLSLMSQQGELVTAMLQIGKPVIVVSDQRPAAGDPDVAARVPAILEAWYAGQEGGTAIGEVLFGDVNPAASCPSASRATRVSCRCTTTAGRPSFRPRSICRASRCGRSGSASVTRRSSCPT
jgi:beta-glucosidase